MFVCSRCNSTTFFLQTDTGRKVCRGCQQVAPSKAYSEIFPNEPSIGLEIDRELFEKSRTTKNGLNRKIFFGALILMIFYWIGTASNSQTDIKEECKHSATSDYVGGHISDSEYLSRINSCK